MQHQRIFKTVGILLIIVLCVVILRFGKSFLIPLAFAGLLSMLLLPICNWFEKKKVNKAIAVLLSILTLVAFFAGVLAFLGWQVSDLAEDTSKVEQQLTQKYQQLQQYISEELGIPKETQEQVLKEQQKSSGGKAGLFTSIIRSLGGTLTHGLLVLVYIFFAALFQRTSPTLYCSFGS